MKTYYARIPGTQLFIRVPRWLYNRWPWCGVVQMPNPFFKGKGCFDGEPRRKRWSMCVRMVAETWMMLGPQLDNVPGTPICLPEKQ